MTGSLRAGAVLLVLGALALAGRSWSETKPAAPRPKMRIGLVNLMQVFGNYDKASAFRQELKTVVAPFQKRDAKVSREVQALLREAVAPDTTPEEKMGIEKKLKGLRRELEDNKAEAQGVLKKKQEEQLKELFTDVEEAAQRYARDHDLELVLHYNEPAAKAEFYKPANLLRKVQAGACVPLYATPGLDISEEILRDLNERMRRKKEA